MADDDRSPETEPTPATETSDGSAAEDAMTESPSESSDQPARDPAPGAVATPKFPWLAAGVGAVALLTIVLVALSYALPAPRAVVPAAWTASPSASATPRISSAKASSSTTPRPPTASAAPISDSPTAFPTSTRCAEGQTIARGSWTAVVPAGWSCAAGATGVGMQSFQSGAGDAISVTPSAAADAVTACSSPFGGQAATVERFADTTWGGRKAVTVNAQFPTLVVQYRCVQTPAGVYIMGGVVRSTAGTLIAGMDGLAASWVWK